MLLYKTSLYDYLHNYTLSLVIYTEV